MKRREASESEDESEAAAEAAAEVGFLNIIRMFHTTFQPNEGIAWSYLSNIILLFG